MSDGNSHFLMALGRHDGGQVVETLDEQLRDVIAAVQRTGKKGAVTLKLEVGANGERGIETSFVVTASAPKLSFGKSFYFSDRTGCLTRNVPDYVQHSLLRAEKQDG